MALLEQQTRAPDEWVEGFQPHPGRRMSETEFLAWCGEKTRAEWVDGEVIIMAPVSFEHDDYNGWFASILRLFVEHHDLGRVCGPELFIRLTASRRQRRLPDLFFVAKDRLNIIRKNHIEGPPDLIVEIISPQDSAHRDRIEKFEQYQAAGVREYWIIDPQQKQVEAFMLESQTYRPVPAEQDKLLSTVLPGFYLRPSWLRQQPLPRVLDVLRELAVLQ